MKLTIRFKGGPGSGHYGHKGIPGHKGGSLPRGESASSVPSNNKLMWRESDSIRDLEDELIGEMKRSGKKFKNRPELYLHVRERLSESGIKFDSSQTHELVGNISNSKWYEKNVETAGQLQLSNAVMDYQATGHFALPKGMKVWMYVESVPSNVWYGAARAARPIYKPYVTGNGDILHNLPGGIFIQKKGSSVAEKARFFEPVDLMLRDDLGRYVPKNLTPVSNYGDVKYNNR